MRIFITSDLHDNKTITDKLLKIDADLILICSDIAKKGSQGKTLKEFSEYQRESIKYLCSVLKKTNIKACFILGNDDWIDMEPNDNEYQFYLDKPEVINGVKLVPFEWIPFTGFDTNREGSQTKIEFELMKLKPQIENNTIIVAHTPPFNTTTDILYTGRNCGSMAVRNWIEASQESLPPLFWCCGHIHESFGSDHIGKTTILNAACQHQTGVLRGWLINTIDGSYEAIQL